MVVHKINWSAVSADLSKDRDKPYTNRWVRDVYYGKDESPELVQRLKQLDMADYICVDPVKLRDAVEKRTRTKYSVAYIRQVEKGHTKCAYELEEAIKQIKMESEREMFRMRKRA